MSRGAIDRHHRLWPPTRPRLSPSVVRFSMKKVGQPVHQSTIAAGSIARESIPAGETARSHDRLGALKELSPDNFLRADSSCLVSRGMGCRRSCSTRCPTRPRAGHITVVLDVNREGAHAIRFYRSKAWRSSAPRLTPAGWKRLRGAAVRRDCEETERRVMGYDGAVSVVGES